MNEGDLPFEGAVSFVSLYRLSCLKGGAIVMGKESSSGLRQTDGGVRWRIGAKTKMSCLKTCSCLVADEITERCIHIPGVSMSE